MIRLVTLALALALLAGCDSIYSAPEVQRAAATDAKVRVLPVTPETVLVANRSNYQPKQLPAVFYASSGGPGQIRGIGALPQPPVGPSGQPARATMNLPPDPSVGPYRIGVGDVLLLATRAGASLREIAGATAENLRQPYAVQDDGTIGIPDVGRVAVSGMTIDEAESAIFQALVRANIDPSLSLEIAEFQSQRVAIGGAVKSAAVVPITQKPLYLNEALSAVGGITAPDRQFITIRIYRDGTIYQIPADELDKRADLQRLRLIAGDSVYVDQTYDLDRAQAYFSQQIQVIGLRQSARGEAMDALNAEVQIRNTALVEAQNNFRAQSDFGAVDRDFVYLTGEVSRQSRLEMPFGNDLSLADALYEQGGYDQISGDSSQIYVLRGSPDPADFGAVTAWHLDASNAVNFVLATRFELRPNDIVFVSQQPVTRWNRTIAQILPTLSLGRQAAGTAAVN